MFAQAVAHSRGRAQIIARECGRDSPLVGAETVAIQTMVERRARRKMQAAVKCLVFQRYSARRGAVEQTVQFPVQIVEGANDFAITTVTFVAQKL